MFLEKYVSEFYFNLIRDNYNEDYLNLLDENNFKQVYNLLKNNGFYFINDIILNYLELFEIDVEYVGQALTTIKNIMGEDYNKQIGENMILIHKIIELALTYNQN